MANYILITYKNNGESVKTGVWADTIENGVEKFLKLRPNISMDDVEKAGIYQRGGIDKGKYTEVITYAEAE